MNHIEMQAEHKISQLLNGVYQKLSKYSEISVSDQERQLLPAEQELMQNLEEKGFYYQSLLRILAIDSYSSVVVSQSMMFDQLCGILTAALQHSSQLGELLKKVADSQTLNKFTRLNECMAASIKISQQMFPKSTYIQDQNKLLQSIGLSTKMEESVISKLRVQNQQLIRKCEVNELQIISMQQKLTKLLKEHDDSERGQSLPNKMSNIELREELAMKDAEIERMNEQFSFQIQKYNTVFEAMKRQLEDMKGYQNIDLIEQIELLETEIVRLREQRQRDQIIIRQLRTDNTIFSSMGTNGYYSPRQSSRFHGSRYDY